MNQQDTPGATPDSIPSMELTDPQQVTLNIEIVGEEGVAKLKYLAKHLQGVESEKAAVLRMIGIFHESVGKEVLVKDMGDVPRSVKGLWR